MQNERVEIWGTSCLHLNSVNFLATLGRIEEEQRALAVDGAPRALLLIGDIINKEFGFTRRMDALGRKLFSVQVSTNSISPWSSACFVRGNNDPDLPAWTSRGEIVKMQPGNVLVQCATGVNTDGETWSRYHKLATAEEVDEFAWGLCEEFELYGLPSDERVDVLALHYPVTSDLLESKTFREYLMAARPRVIACGHAHKADGHTVLKSISHIEIEEIPQILVTPDEHLLHRIL